MNNDITIRRFNVAASKEIKASAHYAYIVNGLTLDGSKFAAGELLVEGQCLMKDNVSGKYEKYADGAASQAKVTGANNITAADLSGINAGTVLKIKVNGVDYTVAKATLAAIAANTTEADIIAAIKTAVDATGGLITTLCNIVATAGHKLVINTLESGSNQSITVYGVFGAPADEAAIEGVLGLALPSSDVGTGEFPEGKSNPVILDESIKFNVKDDGNNPDITAGQVLVHGAVYTSMLTGCTAAFKAACKGINFVE